MDGAPFQGGIAAVFELYAPEKHGFLQFVGHRKEHIIIANH